MSALSRHQRILVQCAPISEARVSDRSMRVALHRARNSEEFTTQQNFDRAIGELVRAIPIPQEITEWVPPDAFISQPQSGWKRLAKNPAILATAIAIGVIAVVVVSHVIDRMNRFPGEPTARHLLTVASSTHSMMLDPVKTSAGSLGDLFFMKHRLAHYDVPLEFADLRTIGTRVFDDEDGQRIAQVWVVEKRMQFFLFPSERDAKTGAVKHFDGWRLIDQEGWSGAVKEENGVCFMAALRGREKDLAPYVAKPKE
jgi:hypothetical protein